MRWLSIGAAFRFIVCRSLDLGIWHTREPEVVTATGAGESRAESLFLPRRRLHRALLIGFMFAAALGVRLAHIDTIDFAPIRSYRSAVLARLLYYQGNPAIPEWEKEVVRDQMKWQGIL